MMKRRGFNRVLLSFLIETKNLMRAAFRHDVPATPGQLRSQIYLEAETVRFAALFAQVRTV